MRFSHIDDTNYPNLNTVDVYAYHNNFDYTRWIPNTKIHLVNVLWDNTYQDCVKFDTDSKRDEFFNNTSNEVEQENTYILTSNALIVNNKVKVPIPYDVACNFNYLFVEIPPFTNERFIDYESEEGVKRWYFFINDFEMKAPNTTVLTLELDYWTQYINSVDINYMQLERGHAPVAAVDTDTFLKNPIEMCDLLLTEDVNHGKETVCRDRGLFIPFGNGEKWTCIASVCPPHLLDYLGEVTSQNSWSMPVPVNGENIPDSSNRWSEWYNIEGYDWSDGKDYANINTPVGNYISTNEIIANNLCIYALPTKDLDNFLQTVISKIPQFMQTIKACFTVSFEMLTIDGYVKIAGFDIARVRGSEYGVHTLKLNRNSFNIESKYQYFTKLYTSPYSEIEITDNNGKTITVKVESLSDNVGLKGITSLAYPYLNARLFFYGINGYGSSTYQWRHLNDVSQEQTIYYSDWYKTCFDLSIPCFELYMDSLTAHNVSSYNSNLRGARQTALTTYRNSIRQLTDTQAATKNVADVTYDNSIRSAYVNWKNAHDQAQVTALNTALEGNANADIAYNDVDLSIYANTRMLQLSLADKTDDVSYKQSMTDALNNKIDKDISINNQLTYDTTAADNTNIQNQADTSSMVSWVGAGGNIIGDTITGASQGGGLGAATAGVASIASNAGNIAQGFASQFNAGSTIACNNTIADKTTQATTDLGQEDKSLNATQLQYFWGNCNAKYLNKESYNNDITNQSATVNKANAEITRSLLTTQGQNTANMQGGNANRLYIENADGSKGGSEYWNAYYTKGSVKLNADYACWAGRENSLDNLALAQSVKQFEQLDSRNQNPSSYGVHQGDATLDYYKNKGLQVRFRSQDKNAIKAAGDYFARFGYALNQNWQLTKWQVMKYFTYWQCGDLWLTSKDKTNNNAQNVLKEILQRGVTVWSEPSMIGRVSIYDNY